MSIWASRFGEEGVNLALDNSFRLQVQNTSTSPFTLNLFNLGGGSSTQTSITTATLSTQSALDLTGLVSFGVVIAPFPLQISQGVSVLYSGSFIIGQTISDIMTAINPLINLQSQSGTFNIQQTAGDLTGNLYDIVISTPSVTKVDFNGGVIQYTPAYTTTSYVTNNPFIKISGTTDINFIQNSEIGNSYKIKNMSVYSSNPNQLLQGLNYYYRDVNGNSYSFGTDPTIDPYQPNNASLQMIYVDNFQIHTNTQFQYTIEPSTSVYLTFNYVGFGYEDFKEFDKIFYQQIRDMYWMEKKLVERRRVRSLHIE